MGASALAYEILWTRMLSLLFGVGIFGVVFTVAAFMAGLGAGSLLASRCCTGWSPRRSLQTVAILEFGIAAYALMLPICMPAIDGWLTETGTTLTLAQWQSFQGVASILILFPAALAMGFAFPLALRAARACGLGVSDMYGVNALGGAMGGIAPLFLLPGFGLNDSVWCVAAFATLMAILALLVARALPAEGEVSTQSTVQRPPFIDLLAYAGIGAAALMLEILWTRIYGMVLLRTEYVLAVLLLVYLVGVGFGSIAAKWLKASWWLNILPVLAAVLAVAGQYLLPSISQWANRATFDSLAQAMLAQGFVILLCTLPVTLVLGAWLPVLARHFDGTSGTQSCGWWYGANSLGAALGVLFAGLIAVPFIGAAMSLVVAALLLMICGFRWLNNVRFWLALPCLLLLMWPVKQLPAVSALLPSLHDGRDIFLYEDAVATTHVVERDNGQRVLLSDLQRMDASSDPTAVIVQKNQARLPLLLHADPKSVLFLGLGTGVTASGALAFSPERCVAVELSLGAIQAASDTFYPVNNGVMQKIDVVHDDVRRFLRRDNARYDVIVGDLFHPDMVGRGNLLSRQEFERVRNRLHEG
ncbi:MAG: spermine synthase, partial [Zetaproteobacteria bacterium CG02_land_8_20_14_3_00_50_9]